MAIERLVSVVVGVVLVAGVFLIMAKPARSAQIIQDYYSQQVARETIRGWLGRPLFAPGKLGSMLALLALVGVMLSIGIFAIYLGISGEDVP